MEHELEFTHHPVGPDPNDPLRNLSRGKMRDPREANYYERILDNLTSSAMSLNSQLQKDSQDKMMTADNQLTMQN